MKMLQSNGTQADMAGGIAFRGAFLVPRSDDVGVANPGGRTEPPVTGIHIPGMEKFDAKTVGRSEYQVTHPRSVGPGHDGRLGEQSGLVCHGYFFRLHHLKVVFPQELKEGGFIQNPAGADALPPDIKAAASPGGRLDAEQAAKVVHAPRGGLARMGGQGGNHQRIALVIGPPGGRTDLAAGQAQGLPAFPLKRMSRIVHNPSIQPVRADSRHPDHFVTRNDLQQMMVETIPARHRQQTPFPGQPFGRFPEKETPHRPVVLGRVAEFDRDFPHEPAVRGDHGHAASGHEGVADFRDKTAEFVWADWRGKRRVGKSLLRKGRGWGKLPVRPCPKHVCLRGVASDPVCGAGHLLNGAPPGGPDELAPCRKQQGAKPPLDEPRGHLNECGVWRDAVKRNHGLSIVTKGSAEQADLDRKPWRRGEIRV